MDSRTFTENTRARLIRQRGEYQRATGLSGASYYQRVAELSGVSPSWIHKFALGSQSNPGVDTIDAVFYALDELDGVDSEAA